MAWDRHRAGIVVGLTLGPCLHWVVLLAVVFATWFALAGAADSWCSGEVPIELPGAPWRAARTGAAPGLIWSLSMRMVFRPIPLKAGGPAASCSSADVMFD